MARITQTWFTNVVKKKLLPSSPGACSSFSKSQKIAFPIVNNELKSFVIYSTASAETPYTMAEKQHVFPLFLFWLREAAGANNLLEKGATALMEFSSQKSLWNMALFLWVGQTYHKFQQQQLEI